MVEKAIFLEWLKEIQRGVKKSEMREREITKKFNESMKRLSALL